MASVEFLQPRLLGARFNDGAIPLEVLTDLAALREMVLDVAKWRFMEANPGRSRSPRGFANKIDLKLTGIGDGSAIPIISLTTTEPILSEELIPHRPFFEMAREDIANAIGTAEDDVGTAHNGHLPNRYLAYFNRIGRSLRDGECLELATPERQEPARLTAASRQRLLQRSTMVEITQQTILRGTVPEADHDRLTFELQQIYGGKVVGPMPEQHRETIIAAFNGYQDKARIMVQGVSRFDRQNRLSGLESIEQVTLLDPLDVPARLDELRAMQDGWLDGDGKAPSHAGLDWLSASFERHFPDDLPLPHLYPTPEGGIEAEWSLGVHSVIFEIHFDTYRGEWLRFAKDNDDDEDSKTLDLSKASSWEWFSGEIRRMAEEESC